MAQSHKKSDDGAGKSHHDDSTNSREGADIDKGSTALSKFVSMLQRFGFPAGMFPLSGVEEFGFVEKSGVWWIRQKARHEHEFQIAKLVVYMKEISGRIQENKIVDFKGWKMKQVMNKDLFLSLAFKEVWLDDPPSGLIHFRNSNGDVESFPIEAFAVGQ